MKQWFKLGIICITIAGMLFSGCNKKPEQKPIPKAPRPHGQTKMQVEPTISLYINDTGEKKQIKLEKYLEGVVAAEMDPQWPVQALAAQAILARTFTMENIKASRVKKLHGTDASTSVEEFQAYDPKRINNKVRQAVKMTRGKVVTYQGKYIHAWFHACGGGKTATALEGLAYTKDPTPYVKVTKDNCLAITVPENKQWTAKFSKGQVSNAIQQQGVSNHGEMNTISIVKKGPSGRAEKLRIGKAVVGGPALRLALGSEKLRSTLLTKVFVQGDQVVFQGKGFGHGVGMCQWGANYQARKGKTPDDIVRYYFKNIQIVKKWK